MIVYGCGISDSNRHLHENLPVVVMGGGTGAWKAGRHVRYKEPVPLTNLYLTMLGHVGVPLDRLGDSTGKLDL